MKNPTNKPKVEAPIFRVRTTVIFNGKIVSVGAWQTLTWGSYVSVEDKLLPSSKVKT